MPDLLLRSNRCHALRARPSLVDPRTRGVGRCLISGLLALALVSGVLGCGRLAARPPHSSAGTATTQSSPPRTRGDEDRRGVTAVAAGRRSRN